MAKGDFTLATQAKLDLGKKVHNLLTDTFYFACIKSLANGGFDPSETMTDPRWGTGGGVDVSASEVAATGNYVAGGVVLSGVAWVIDGTGTKFSSNNPKIIIDPANPTNARWGIIYNNTAVGKQVVGFIDLGSDLDLTTDDLDYILDTLKGYFKND